MFGIILIILMCVFSFWLFFKFFKIVLRFLFYMFLATIIGHLILKSTSFTIDNKWIPLIAIILFILSIIRSNSSDGLSTFWEDFSESTFVQIIIGLLKIVFRFAIYMILATLALRFTLKFTTFPMDNKYYVLLAIAMFILSVVRSTAPKKPFSFRKRSSKTEYVYTYAETPKNYVLNSKSGIIHSRWDSSADDISEDHKISLSDLQALNLVSKDHSIRFKRDN